MATQVQRRRGTHAQVAAFTGAQGEVVYDADQHRVVAQDGVTTGGYPHALLSEVLYDSLTWGGTAGGTGDAATITLAQPPTAYTAGMRVRYLASASNTISTPTISVNAIGAKTIKHQDGTSLSINDITAGSYYELDYDGSAFRLASTGPSSSQISGGWAATIMAGDLTLTSASARGQTVTPDQAGRSIILPDTTTLNKGGPVFVLENVGSYPVLLKKNGALVLGWLLPNTMVQLFVENNSSAAGTWRVSADGQIAGRGVFLAPDIWPMPAAPFLASSGLGFGSCVTVSLANNLALVFTKAQSTDALTCVAIRFGSQGLECSQAATTLSSSAVTGIFDACRVSATRAAIMRSTAASTPVIQTIDVNTSTLAVTANTTGAMAAVVVAGADIELLDSTGNGVVVVGYSETTSAGVRAVAASLPAGSAAPTIGSPVQIVGNAGLQPRVAILSNATLFHIFYRDSTATRPTVCRVTASGTTLTAGTPVVIRSADAQPVGFFFIDSTHACCVYGLSASTLDLVAQVITDTGASITTGADVVLLTNSAFTFVQNAYAYGTGAGRAICFLIEDNSFPMSVVPRAMVIKATASLASALAPISFRAPAWGGGVVKPVSGTGFLAGMAAHATSTSTNDSARLVQPFFVTDTDT